MSNPHADSIREWVTLLLQDHEIKLPTLDKMSAADLRNLELALDTAGAAWMSALVHEVMKP